MQRIVLQQGKIQVGWHLHNQTDYSIRSTARNCTSLLPSFSYFVSDTYSATPAQFFRILIIIAISFCTLAASYGAWAGDLSQWNYLKGNILAIDEPDGQQVIDNRIEVLSDLECMNTQFVEMLDTDWVLVQITSTPCHNWFYFKLRGVKNRTVTVSITGDDIGASKWNGLRPVYSYISDPGNPASFEWFEYSTIPPEDMWSFGISENGAKVRLKPKALAQPVWWSGDWLKPANERGPFAGELPPQSVIPSESASEFFYQGKHDYWQPWQDIADAQYIAVANAFRFTQRFTQDEVLIAMRYPFTPELMKHQLQRVARNYTDIEIQRHPDYSALFIPSPATNPVGLSTFYAREHATEHDTSFVAFGALHQRLYAQGSDQIPVAIVPIVDIRSALASSATTFAPTTELKPLTLTPGGRKTAKSLSVEKWLLAKHNGVRQSMVIDLHNVEANEISGVWLPFWDTRIKDRQLELTNSLKAILAPCKLDVITTPIWEGYEYRRLFGTLMTDVKEHNRAIGLPVEVNSRCVNAQMSLKELDNLGARMFDWSVTTLNSLPKGDTNGVVPIKE